MQQDDRQRLLRQLANPKERENAFAYIVKLYKEPLYWKIRSMVLSHEDANDLLQNTFLKAWNGLDSFHGEAKVETWLYRIAVNETLDFLRKQKLRSGLSSEMSDRVAAQLMANPYFDGDKSQALLQEAISRLPEVQRTVFTLRYYDNMKYADMSALLDTSEGALKASYHIAVRKITDYLKLKA